MELQRAWRFFPANATFAIPTNPFSGGLPAGAIQVTNLQQNTTGVNFKGVKVVDVNNNAQSGG